MGENVGSSPGEVAVGQGAGGLDCRPDRGGEKVSDHSGFS